MSRATSAVALLLALLAPRAAAACAVCLSGGDETRAAYYLTTGLLASLPLVVGGALALGLGRMRRARRPRAPVESERRAPPRRAVRPARG